MTLQSQIRQVSDGEFPLELALVCGAIAALLVFPLAWLFIEVTTIELGRARRLLTSPGTISVLINSLYLMVGVTACSILVGVPLAYLTVRTDLPFRRFWKVAVALPLVIPSYIGAFAFDSAFGQRGEFQSLLSPIGIDSVPEISGLSGTIFIITLYTYPYVYLTTRASLLSFDTRLIDAAQTLNHGRLAAFRRVTLPQIRPAIAAGGLLCALYAVSDFGTPAIMQLSVFTREIYVEYNAFNPDFAVLLSLQLLVVVVVVLAIESMLSQDQSAGGGDGTETQPKRVRLGKWRWPALLFPLAVTMLAIAVPIWILLLWVQRTDSAYREDLTFELIYALNSVEVAVQAAIVAVIVAIPIAYFSANYDSVFATIFERATYVGFAVPGVVLGLALVYFGSGRIFYQTVPFLVFAYVVRFIPQVVGSTRASLLQVDPRLVEAGRVLGESSLGAFRRVTFPLVRSGIVAGGALVFLTTMKELPVTLILRPSGFRTIVSQIWNAQAAGLYQHAAAPALLLVAISGLSMVVLLAQEGGEGGSL